jgi:gliding motility-associated-like protein
MIPQTITFTSYPDRLLVTETFELVASATSGLPVSFESKEPEVARVNGSVLTGLSRGNANIRAYQQGNENYYAAEDEITVEVVSTHENIMYLFTPNNDGFNDFWEIPELDSYGSCEVKVYNRWGKLVFSSSEYHNEWDGTSNGANLPSAAYYFIIKTETAGTITGTLNIVR